MNDKMRRRFLSNIKSISGGNGFSIEALEDGLTAKLSTNTCEYRIDNGSWIMLSAGSNTQSINKGQTLSFRGNLIPTSSSGIGTFTISKKCNIKGNIMSLLYGDDFIGQIDLSGKSYAFYNLFKNCTTLQNAENLILPSTTLANYCYQSMFNGCTGLTSAPKLPATTLANNCYSNMFNGCTGLTSAPELPAATLASNCYENMFRGCTSLTTVPQLPATTLAEYCYQYMFQGCTSLTTAPELPTTTLASSCYSYMFYGCTGLTTAPELPATTLKDWCYSSMFLNCTSLTTVPELPATTLEYGCYSGMFYGCNGLTTAPELPATTLASSCYQSMFYGCTGLATAPELPATTLAYHCYSSMFNGCTSLTTAPELPATTLVQDCYYSIFNGCSKLSSITMLATNISASNCLYNWVSGVASSGTFIKSGIEIQRGVNGIPNGWTVQVVTPSISNTLSTPIDFNYNEGMFTPIVTVELTKIMSEENILSLQPMCDITINVINKDDTLHTSDYLWVNTKISSDVMKELNISNINDIAIVIVDADIPEDGGYYYYMLDETEPIVEKDWMRVVSLEDDNTISLSKDIHYSVNGDEWRKLYANNTITVNSDDIVYFKGTNIENQFTVSKAFNVEGNIMSLLYGDNFEGQIDLSGKSYAFYNLFKNCTTLQNAKNLILPATTLPRYCYTSMFYGCKGLTTAPELPATTLADDCYSNMFYGCTSLTTAPEVLPATSLAEYCYESMFYGCTSLTEAPQLPATTLANGCYDSMFFNCTSLTEAPQLPATTLATECYYYMFRGCTSLTEAPELPATTLANSCYQYMFFGCSNLNYIKMLATDISASSCLSNWLFFVSSSGTFVKHPDMTTLPSGTSGIPNGWTVQDA